MSSPEFQAEQRRAWHALVDTREIPTLPSSDALPETGEVPIPDGMDFGQAVERLTEGQGPGQTFRERRATDTIAWQHAREGFVDGVLGLLAEVAPTELNINYLLRNLPHTPEVYAAMRLLADRAEKGAPTEHLHRVIDAHEAWTAPESCYNTSHELLEGTESAVPGWSDEAF